MYVLYIHVSIFIYKHISIFFIDKKAYNKNYLIYLNIKKVLF